MNIFKLISQGTSFFKYNFLIFSWFKKIIIYPGLSPASMDLLIIVRKIEDRCSWLRDDAANNILAEQSAALSAGSRGYLRRIEAKDRFIIIYLQRPQQTPEGSRWITRELLFIRSFLTRRSLQCIARKSRILT